MTELLWLLIGMLVMTYVWHVADKNGERLARARAEELQSHVEYLHERVLAAYGDTFGDNVYIDGRCYPAMPVDDSVMMHAERARVLTDPAYAECAYGADDESDE